LNFEEACNELGLPENELERLIADGEIASFKEGDTLFFKKEVIENFKKSRDSEDNIILTDGDMDILDGLDEIDLDSEDEPAVAEISPADEPISLDATPEELGIPENSREASPVDEISLDDIPDIPELEEDVVIEPRKSEEPAGMGAPDDTVLNLDGLLEDDGSEGTTPIPGMEGLDEGLDLGGLDESSDITVEGNVSDDTLLDTDLLDLGDEEDSFKLDETAADDTLVDPTEATLLRGGGARAMQMKRKKSHAAWTVLLVATAIILLVPLGVCLNTLFITGAGETDAIVTTSTSNEPIYQWILDSNVLGGLIEGIADLW